jgi:serine protease AprX
VIVAEQAPGSDAAERAVRAVGGTVGRPLPLVGGRAARVPAHAVAALRRDPSVRGLWPDAALRPRDDDALDNDLSAYDARPADPAWRQAVRLGTAGGDAGAGVRVAVIDTGVARTPVLEANVVARVDLSPDADGQDRYGHGSHMAGLVAGPTGAAPRAGVVAVKVADWNGAVDVSTVIAALQWVVTHRHRYAIRVVNLSYGTDSTQPAAIDPLDLAVERAWDAGLLVVVAAGNNGANGDGSIEKPGDDPLVLTVGAADTMGTADPADDEVAPFSARGPTPDDVAKPDLVAPGVSLVSARAPGSTVDNLRPAARVGPNRFKGTGTSQATAVVSGIAARMFAAAPGLTPDQAKAALIATADPALAGRPGAGAGLVDAAAAVEAVAGGAFAGLWQDWPRSTGLGSIDASRGGQRVYADVTGDGVPENVSGEIDVLGAPWDPAAFASTAWTADTWAASPWSALTAVGEGWQAASRPVATWTGAAWEIDTWTAKRWSDLGWVAKRWSDATWSTGQWN